MELPLGRRTEYSGRYDPSLLFPVARSEARSVMGMGAELPFFGEDLWTGYELTWLDPRGKPHVRALRLSVPCDSPNIVESKSMKLYLNSFSETRYDDHGAVARALTADLGAAFGKPVSVELLGLDQLGVGEPPDALCLDDLDVTIDRYERAPELLELAAGAPESRETLYTHLFRSLCPVTGQPDYATLIVRYDGPAISHEALLRYLVSFRCHQAFHEATVEQIFLDIRERCRCESLWVYGGFLRRGGIDINPFRSSLAEPAPRLRLSRQ